MDRLTRVLAGLLERSACLLPAARREWAEAVLAEAGDIPAGPRRLAWLCGGLWLVAREVVMGTDMRAFAFAAGATGLVWIGWPGASSNSATPLNRVYVIGAVLLLAVLPGVVRSYAGPVRRGWAPRAARAGSYLLVLVLIAAKAVKDRYGSKLGAYFVIVPGEWVLEIVLLLIIVGYVAGLFILTSQRIRLARWSLPVSIGLGALTAGVLYAQAPFGADGGGWGVLVALALPVTVGWLAGRLGARDARHAILTPEEGARQGWLAGSCAIATAALLLAVLTEVTIALFPHQVPLELGPTGRGNSYIAGGGCETCEPVNTVIPRGLRDDYWVEISIGQAGDGILALLMIAPFVGAGLGALGGGLAGKSRRSKRHGDDPQADSSPTLDIPGRTLPSG